MSTCANRLSRQHLPALAACFFALQAVVLAQEKPGATTTPEQVVQVIQRVRSAELDDNIFATALTLGNNLLRERRFAEASELFGALAEKRPSDPAVLYRAALATFNAGRAAEAEPLARKAVDTALAARTRDVDESAGNQRAAEALVMLAVVLAVRSDDAGALKAAQEAVRLAPDNFNAQLALGRALFGSGDNTSATRALQTAVSLRPSDGQARFFLATALEREGDEDGALKAYRELITRQPNYAEGHLGLGVLLVKRGDEQGMKELRRALEINPNLYEARVTLGRELVTRGHAAEAIDHLRRAAELAPDNPEPHYQLSLAYRRLGRKADAEAESAIVKRIHESRRGPTQAGTAARSKN